jgi:transitional endoplasmic reticulum ATPase
VIVIAATNIPDALDPALRRGGRFDREIEIGIPDKKGRLKIFQIHSRNVPLDIESIALSDENLSPDEKTTIQRIEREIADLRTEKEKSAKPETADKKIADAVAQQKDFTNSIRKRLLLEPFANRTHGFVGADISLAVKEAAMHALRTVLQTVDPKDIKEGKIDKTLVANLKVTQADFDAALNHVQPSAMREVLVEVPDVGWKDVGGLDEVKQELTEAVEWPLKFPDIFSRLRTKPPKGILLFGPPGTGKTLLAKAVANESECNFISVKGPELLSKWVGESEKGVREIFRRARQAAPSIIFFDEVDALVPKRGLYQGSSHVTESVVSQILTELDGLEELKNVVVLAATNRPDMIDTALMRPGRLDRVIYVPPPDAEGRTKIFSVYLENAGEILAADVDADELVRRTEGYVGADIEALVREAKLAAMREFITAMTGKSETERQDAIGNVRITRAHFEEAMKKVRGSLDPETLEQSERQAWEMIYNQEQRSILDEAVTTVKRADLLMKTIKSEEIKNLRTELREKLYQRRKDFPEISRLTKDLEGQIDEAQKKAARMPAGIAR